jgi:hypothetical protein
VSKVTVKRPLPGRIAEAEALWYDPSRWPAFVDGFGHVAKLEGSWPKAGARLTWDSMPGGRGRVVERVVEHVVRERQRVEVEDERLEGLQSIEWAANEQGCELTLTLDYRLKNARFGSPIVDALFIRRAIRDSLARTANRFRRELAADLELSSLGSGAPPVP